MTTNDLTRAQEIQNELSTLKSALSQLNKATIFNCDESIRCYGNKADSFLSEVHVNLKTIGVSKITKKIAELEKEFEKL